VNHYTGSVPDTTHGADWRARAACRESGPDGALRHAPEQWFPVGDTGPALLQTEEAKRVCYRCPVIDDCLQYALNAGIEHGVWGGLAENERRAMKRRASRRTAVPRQDLPDMLVFSKTSTLEEACRELCDRYTVVRDGHIVWVADRTQVKILHRERTYGQIGFQAGLGRWPDGPVKRTCGVDRCVAPQCLTDRTIRAARAAETSAAAAS